MAVLGVRLRSQLSHYVAPDPVDFTLRLSSCRFHERNFRSKSGQQKALENDLFSMAYCLVAGTRNTRFLRLVEQAIPQLAA
jgi:hypothetical protein